MGSILLDTHAFIWLSENDSNLPNSVLKIIDNTENVFVSIISLWEIAIKLNIGKITLQEDFNKIEARFSNTRLILLPI
jgi:PIN domain nuclease of toxin-antitoxin system